MGTEKSVHLFGVLKNIDTFERVDCPTKFGLIN
jgi:hypothetical protein